MSEERDTENSTLCVEKWNKFFTWLLLTVCLHESPLPIVIVDGHGSVAQGPGLHGCKSTLRDEPEIVFHMRRQNTCTTSVLLFVSL